MLVTISNASNCVGSSYLRLFLSCPRIAVRSADMFLLSVSGVQFSSTGERAFLVQKAQFQSLVLVPFASCCTPRQVLFSIQYKAWLSWFSIWFVFILVSCQLRFAAMMAASLLIIGSTIAFVYSSIFYITDPGSPGNRHYTN